LDPLVNPQFEHLSQTFKAFLSDKSTLEDLLASFLEFQKWREDFHRYFSKFAYFEEKVVLQTTPFQQVLNLLKSLKISEERFRFFVEKKEFLLAENMLQTLAETLQELFKALQAIQKQEAERKHYCKIPMIQELVRLGIAVEQKRFPLEKYEMMLDKALAYHKSYEAFVQKEFEGNSRVPETLWGAFKGEMKRIQDCLESIYARIKQRKSCQENLNALAFAGNSLFNILQKLEVFLGEPDKLVCFHCGKANPKTSRFCEACNTALPKFF
jgi:hypothetical protein